MHNIPWHAFWMPIAPALKKIAAMIDLKSHIMQSIAKFPIVFDVRTCMFANDFYIDQKVVFSCGVSHVLQQASETSEVSFTAVVI